jgi:hypothetical protein
MAYHLEFARWAARLRAPLALALAGLIGACDATDKLTDVSDEPTITSTEPVTDPDASFSSRFRGGIPIGTSAQPTSAFGSEFNGGFRNIYPQFLLRELAAIKARGGKVALTFSGNEENFKDRRGHFDLGKWKARVNRFRGVNFSSYVRDGTIIGHLLIDEPYDPVNWHGKPVPGATLEAMGRYSKQLWPQLATIVRAAPDEMKWSRRYQHVDAAWAQYRARKGNVHEYVRRNVSSAQRMGLALIVGLNLRDGGNPNRTPMNGNEIKTYGSTLLSSSYPCAFLMWQYNSRYLKNRDIRNAMAHLRNRAQNRSTKSCKS